MCIEFGPEEPQCPIRTPANRNFSPLDKAPKRILSHVEVGRSGPGIHPRAPRLQRSIDFLAEDLPRTLLNPDEKVVWYRECNAHLREPRLRVFDALRPGNRVEASRRGGRR